MIWDARWQLWRHGNALCACLPLWRYWDFSKDTNLSHHKLLICHIRILEPKTVFFSEWKTVITGRNSNIIIYKHYFEHRPNPSVPEIQTLPVSLKRVRSRFKWGRSRLNEIDLVWNDAVCLVGRKINDYIHIYNKCRWVNIFSINSSLPRATYMRQWTGSALVQVKACRLFGDKPLP